MDKQTAIQKAGSAMALAKLLGITRQAISQWGETLPPARVWQLKALKPEWFAK
jgi:DNA-binding transcriptional regulator YdaS (Cro superfamily)